MAYIEHDFPIEGLNKTAQKEGNAKKPIYQMHKWWARRLGSVFRMLLLAAPIAISARSFILEDKSAERPQ